MFKLLAVLVALSLISSCAIAPESRPSATEHSSLLKQGVIQPTDTALQPIPYVKDYMLFDAVFQQVSNFYRIDGAGIVERHNIKRFKDFSKVKDSCAFHVYQLKNCQAASVAALILNNIPVVFERVYSESDPETRHGIFVQYLIKPNNNAVGEFSNKYDKEFIYLMYNIDNSLNHLKALSKSRVDNNQLAYSADLFDLDQKRNYDAKLRDTSFTTIKNTSQYDVKLEVEIDKYQHIFINYLYIVVPQVLTPAKVQELINNTLGDRDFSYKAPELVQLL